MRDECFGEVSGPYHGRISKRPFGWGSKPPFWVLSRNSLNDSEGSCVCRAEPHNCCVALLILPIFSFLGYPQEDQGLFGGGASDVTRPVLASITHVFFCDLRVLDETTHVRAPR